MISAPAPWLVPALALCLGGVGPLVGCAAPAANGSGDDDDSADAGGQTFGPANGCLSVAVQLDEVRLDTTSALDDLVGLELQVTACGLATEVRDGGVTRWGWTAPTVTIQGAPDGVGAEIATGWSDGWALLAFLDLDGEVVLHSGQVGGGNHLLTLNRTAGSGTNLTLGGDGNPVLAPVTAGCEALLAFVPDLNQADVVADTLADVDAIAGLAGP